MDDALSAYGRLDAIHNNAGIASPSAPLHTTTEEEWELLQEAEKEEESEEGESDGETDDKDSKKSKKSKKKKDAEKSGKGDAKGSPVGFALVEAQNAWR